MNEIEKKILDVIDNLNPYLISDGGGIEFVKYEDNFVYVKMQGSCANCDMLNITLRDGVERIIKDEIPDVKGVININ